MKSDETPSRPVEQRSTVEKFLGIGEQLSADAWRNGLAPEGRLVLSDLIPRGYDVRRDNPVVLLFSLRRGTPLRALIEGVTEWRRYRQVHRSVSLLTIAPEELSEQAKELGLETGVVLTPC